MTKTYYEKNKDRIKQRTKKYFEENREKVRSQKREWAKKHREELRKKGLIPPTKQQRIDKAIEYIKDKLSSLNMNKSAIMRIVEPSNGYLLADVNYEIQKWERLLEILGDKE